MGRYFMEVYLVLGEGKVNVFGDDRLPNLHLNAKASSPLTLGNPLEHVGQAITGKNHSAACYTPCNFSVVGRDDRGVQRLGVVPMVSFGVPTKAPFLLLRRFLMPVTQPRAEFASINCVGLAFQVVDLFFSIHRLGSHRTMKWPGDKQEFACASAFQCRVPFL